MGLDYTNHDSLIEMSYDNVGLSTCFAFPTSLMFPAKRFKVKKKDIRIAKHTNK